MVVIDSCYASVEKQRLRLGDVSLVGHVIST